MPRWSLSFAPALLAALAAFPAYAADTVIGTVSGTHYPGSTDEAAVALTLQHGLNDGGLLVGLAGTEFPVGSLTELDLDAYRVQSPRFVVTGGFSVGDAVGTNTSDTLFKGRLYVDSQLNPSWLLHAGYQYIDLDVIRGHLLTASAEYRPVPVWGIKMGGGYDAHGTLADRYGSAELNWYGAQHLFAGAVLGRTGYDPATLGEVAVVQRLFQLYLGASVPLPAGTLTLGLDTLNLENSARQTLRIGLIEPIK